MSQFDRFAFNARPDFDEAATRRAFRQAVPLRTVVIYCYDPRATEIPNAVAARLGNEVYPGEVIVDEAGNRVASTTTLFPVVVAGGRAVDALRSIAVAQHLFGIRNIAVVHHAHCGATTFTAGGIIAAHRHEQGADISKLYDPGSICIGDYETSLRHDTALIRAHPGTPKHANVYGFFYDIDARSLTEVVKDLAQDAPYTWGDAGSIGEKPLSIFG